MNETKPTLVEALFELAAQKPTAVARAEFLDGVCRDNPALRARLEVLLEGHFAGDGFLTHAPERELPAAVTTPHAEEAPAEMIGRYKLLEKIGEGGFGEVWMAEQREPVKRRVALKIIKLGMDSRQIVARFEAERQALAMMDHANIAKIFDAGMTEAPVAAGVSPAVEPGVPPGGNGIAISNARESSQPGPGGKMPASTAGGTPAATFAAGRPYFVMELVRGVKITEYCDQNQLPTHERLKLFVLVCQAIQHAHQKGIIHRDIKPSNILVTLHDGVPVPKVIDFGIAKATQGELTDRTVFTQFQQFIGTPAYISPEQAEMSGLDIDTRADIYSLGVLLYELLVGQTPFDVKEMMQGGIDALRQIIREKEPLRPSTKLNTLQGDARTTAGKRRQTDVGKLVHQLQGDLDWIVMKCLEKDRTRRYETANGLAMDIQRHLANEPVIARPPSAAYKFQKAWQRNKLVFTAGAVVAVALVAGIGISTWQAVRATRANSRETVQRKLAEVQRNDAEAQRKAAVEQRKLADMQLALQAWDDGIFQRANDLIEASGPAPGESPAFEWRYLRKLCQDQSIETYGGQNHQYLSAQFFDRDLILLNDEKTLTLRDLSSRKEQVLLKDQDGIRSPALCSENTNLLATVTDDGSIKVWDLAANRLRVELGGHPEKVGGGGPADDTIAFSRDGKWLASAISDKSVKLWEVEARSPEPRILHRYAFWTSSDVFSPDGRHVFSGGSEPMIRTWDVATGVEVGSPLEGHAGWVYALAMSPDGLRLASGGPDCTVIVWDVMTRKLVTRLIGHIAAVRVVAFSPDGQILASAGRDHTIRLWDWKTGRQLSLLRGHGARVKSLSFSPDGQRLVSQSQDGLVKLWQVTPGLDGNAFTGGRISQVKVALSPDGRRLASLAPVGVTNFAANLWDLSTGSQISLAGHTASVICAAFSPDGRMLATGSHDQTVRLWDVNDQRVIATLTHGFPVGSLAFSPDGRTLVVGGSSISFLLGGLGGLQFWDVPTRQATGTIPGDAADVSEMALSANGSLLATVHNDGIVNLWDAQTRRLLHRFENPFGSGVNRLAFSPTEPFLAAGDWSGNIVLYNTATMQVAPPALKAYTERVMSLAFSPDGRTLASTGEGGGLKLWHVAMRQVALTLKGHVGPVSGITFSQDGNFMVTCGSDPTVRLWPAATLEEANAAKENAR